MQGWNPQIATKQEQRHNTIATPLHLVPLSHATIVCYRMLQLWWLSSVCFNLKVLSGSYKPTTLYIVYIIMWLVVAFKTKSRCQLSLWLWRKGYFLNGSYIAWPVRQKFFNILSIGHDVEHLAWCIYQFTPCFCLKLAVVSIKQNLQLPMYCVNYLLHCMYTCLLYTSPSPRD